MALVIRPGSYPPQGFPFVDKRTGMRFAGMSQSLLGRAREVIRHRLANPTIYPQHEPIHFNLQAVTQEIVDPICKKHPQFCMETTPVAPPTSAAPTVVAPPITPKCGVCGSTEWKPEYCPTCSGQRLTGYICLKCGSKRRK